MPQEHKIVSGLPQPGAYGIAGSEALVEPQFQAQHVVLKPTPYQFGGQILGHYRMAAPTGLTTTIAAGGRIFSLRWADTKALLLLKRIKIAACLTTVFTTGQPIDVDAAIVRGFTAADTGGTAISLGGSNQKNRIIMGSSLVADMRIATTAALGAGTSTADAQAFAAEAIPMPGNVLGQAGSTELYKFDATNQHPVMLGYNEGINLRIVTTQGTAGVIKFYIIIEWAEVLAI